MRIILADHHKQSLWALKTMIQEGSEFDLVGVVEDAQSLLTLAEKHTADLFLVERNLPGSPIEDLINRLHALNPRPFVVVMSSEFEYSRMLLKAGADAFVSKGDEPEWLLDRLYKFEGRIRSADK
jgi:DNA-binding NarL/FixJ family response regulator